MKERVISQSSRLQRNRPSNCDRCNGAGWQRTLLRRISTESIAYLLNFFFEKNFLFSPLFYRFPKFDWKLYFKFISKQRYTFHSFDREEEEEERWNPFIIPFRGIGGICCFENLKPKDRYRVNFQVKCWRQKGAEGRKSETAGWMGHWWGKLGWL